MIYTEGMMVPGWGDNYYNYPTVAQMTVDADTEKAAWRVEAPKTGTITKVILVWTSVTTEPGANYDIRLETLSGGVPSGTLLDTNTNGSVLPTSATDDTYTAVTLTGSVSVTRGDQFAVVAVPPASPNNGNVNWGCLYNDGLDGFPNGVLYTGSWTAQSSSPSIYFEYSDASIPPMLNAVPVVTWSWNSSQYSDSTYPYHGNAFTPNVNMEVMGAYTITDCDAPDIDLTIYSGTSTVVKTVNQDIDIQAGSGLAYLHKAYFTSDASLTKGTQYRVVHRNPYATASGTPIQHHFAILGTTAGGFGDLENYFPNTQFFEDDSFYRTYAGAGLTGWTDDTDRKGGTGLILRSVS